MACHCHSPFCCAVEHDEALIPSCSLRDRSACMAAGWEIDCALQLEDMVVPATLAI